MTGSGPSVARRSRVDALTSLRAVAAAAVFFLHFSERVGGQPGEILYILSRQGQVGVVFFFCLSGFILTWSHRTGDTAKAFWRRRFARIYPAYLVALVGGILLDVVAHGRTPTDSPHFYADQGQLLVRIGLQTFLVQAWAPLQRFYFSLNGVGWSLSCEALFYALFPLLIVFVPRLSIKGRRVLQAAALGGIIVFSAVAQYEPSSTANWLLLHAPFTTLLQFVLGVTVALDVTDGHWTRLRLGPVLLVNGAVYLVCTIWFMPLTTVALAMVPILALLAAAAQPQGSLAERVLSRRWFIWLGEVSYCFYLVHQLVTRASAAVVQPSTWPTVVLLFLADASLSLVLAWGLHRVVERPFERILRGRSRRVAPVTLTT